MPSPISTIKKRRDFLLAASQGFKFVRPFFIIQCRKRDGLDASADIRVGYTATKKLGNAVVRNRIKRRLRAMAAKLLPELGLSGYDYVLIGREQIKKAEFTDLLKDMQQSLTRLAEQIKKNTDK